MKGVYYEQTTFAVSTIVYIIAAASAPISESQAIQLLLPIENGLMALSARYPNIRITGLILRIRKSSGFGENRMKPKI